VQVAEVIETETVDDAQSCIGGPSVSATAMARLSSTTGEAVRWRDRGVIGGLTIGMEACSVAEGSPDLGPVLLALLLDLNRGLDESWHPSSMLVPSVSLSLKLRVTTAEIEYMPFYLRVFFRLLSSWVHTRLSCYG
jgi:hypothetical protein